MSSWGSVNLPPGVSVMPAPAAAASAAAAAGADPKPDPAQSARPARNHPSQLRAPASQEADYLTSLEPAVVARLAVVAVPGPWSGLGYSPRPASCRDRR